MTRQVLKHFRFIGCLLSEEKDVFSQDNSFSFVILSMGIDNSFIEWIKQSISHL
jgi:hypothetical protein